MPTLRLFGFPVRVKVGFVVFLAVVIAWKPSIGWQFALAVTVFSLIHELGHAFAARRLGAQPEIALDFLAGSTRYTPPRAITPLERASVAVAGPLIESVVGLVILAAMRVNPLDVQQVFDSTPAAVVWIAGPVFGLLNLLPMFPLDGGHVLAGVVETFAPRTGAILATALSASISVVLLGLTLSSADVRWLAPFAGLLVALHLWPFLPVPARFRDRVPGLYLQRD
ncbi:MAG: metalloprotease [Ilumatobacteraceae bacterium]